MTLRKAAMTIWKTTVLKKKKALTNSSLLLKSAGYQLVMNLQPCATAFYIAKTSTLNIGYLSSLSGLSMLCRGSNCSITWLLKCWPPRSAFCILKSSSESYVCHTCEHCRFGTQPSVCRRKDYLNSPGMNLCCIRTDCVQIWTKNLILIIIAWYDISLRFNQNCGLWLIESWKPSPPFGWNDQLTITKGGDFLKQCHSSVDWWESTCSYNAPIVGPRPPLIQMWSDIRGTNLAQRGGSRSPPFAFTTELQSTPTKL